MRRQSPPLAQRAAPVSVGRILSMPHADFNGARAGVQMKPIRVPMDQPPLAVGENPRLVDRRVVAVGLPIVSGSIPGLRPSLRLQSAPATGPIPQLFSWCVCSCGVVVHSIREESNPLIPSFRGNCQDAHFRPSSSSSSFSIFAVILSNSRTRTRRNTQRINPLSLHNSIAGSGSTFTLQGAAGHARLVRPRAEIHCNSGTVSGADG